MESKVGGRAIISYNLLQAGVFLIVIHAYFVQLIIIECMDYYNHAILDYGFSSLLKYDIQSFQLLYYISIPVMNCMN